MQFEDLMEQYGEKLPTDYTSKVNILWHLNNSYPWDKDIVFCLISLLEENKWSNAATSTLEKLYFWWQVPKEIMLNIEDKLWLEKTDFTHKEEESIFWMYRLCSRVDNGEIEHDEIRIFYEHMIVVLWSKYVESNGIFVFDAIVSFQEVANICKEDFHKEILTLYNLYFDIYLDKENPIEKLSTLNSIWLVPTLKAYFVQNNDAAIHLLETSKNIWSTLNYSQKQVIFAAIDSIEDDNEASSIRNEFAIIFNTARSENKLLNDINWLQDVFKKHISLVKKGNEIDNKSQSHLVHILNTEKSWIPDKNVYNLIESWLEISSNSVQILLLHCFGKWDTQMYNILRKYYIGKETLLLADFKICTELSREHKKKNIVEKAMNFIENNKKLWEKFPEVLQALKKRKRNQIRWEERNNFMSDNNISITSIRTESENSKILTKTKTSSTDLDMDELINPLKLINSSEIAPETYKKLYKSLTRFDASVINWTPHLIYITNLLIEHWEYSIDDIIHQLDKNTSMSWINMATLLWKFITHGGVKSYKILSHLIEKNTLTYYTELKKLLEDYIVNHLRTWSNNNVKPIILLVQLVKKCEKLNISDRYIQEINDLLKELIDQFTSTTGSAIFLLLHRPMLWTIKIPLEQLFSQIQEVIDNRDIIKHLDWTTYTSTYWSIIWWITSRKDFDQILDSKEYYSAYVRLLYNYIKNMSHQHYVREKEDKRNTVFTQFLTATKALYEDESNELYYWQKEDELLITLEKLCWDKRYQWQEKWSEMKYPLHTISRMPALEKEDFIRVFAPNYYY